MGGEVIDSIEKHTSVTSLDQYSFLLYSRYVSLYLQRSVLYTTPQEVFIAADGVHYRVRQLVTHTQNICLRDARP